MSEISRDVNASSMMNMGPDMFQYYISGLSELLYRDDFAPSVGTSRLVGSGSGSVGFGSLFSDAIGDGLPAHRKERLIIMLRQSVLALNKEVDEMLDPVFAMQRLRSLLAPTKSCARHQDADSKAEADIHAGKRLRISVDEPLIGSPGSCNLTEEGSPNERYGMAEPPKSLTRCNKRGCMKSNQKGKPDDTKSLCGDCSKQGMTDSFLGSCSRDNGEVNDDLHVLLENRGPKVEEKMEKHANEISATLDHMLEKIEELLDLVISSCRPMTLAEKHQLRRLIEKLPSQNLDRVVEIMQRGKPPERQASHDITVNLLHEDDLTLWRLYFYVKAVENAQKLL
ncbi:GATA transcription factor 7 [Tanacetum coccineum]|uniref:GATA transcription factor 7 n=1 Tax=Tanacetum coccineum TaxID=301880 RepID=A0ABQ5CCM8_9ASTR